MGGVSNGVTLSVSMLYINPADKTNPLSLSCQRSSYPGLSRLDDQRCACFGLGHNQQPSTFVDRRPRPQTYQQLSTELQLPRPTELCILASWDQPAAVSTPNVMFQQRVSDLTSITCPTDSMLRPTRFRTQLLFLLLHQLLRQSVITF